MKQDKLIEMASKLLRVGKQRLVINNDKYNDNKKMVDDAITREDIRKVIVTGIVEKRKDTGHSRGRARILLEKKKLKRKRGPGKRKGTPKAREKGNIYNLKIRGLRKKLKELKEKDALKEKNYRKLYKMVKGNYFRGKKHLEEHVNEIK
ncbi:MAG: 50S ribosomal protein L19e [archaeon]